MSMDLAIDLGTSNIRIYSDKKGKMLDEPSVVTIDIDTGNVLALGTEASKMIGRTSTRIKALYPLTGGVISDFYLVEEMISTMLKGVCNTKFIMPKVVACVPGEITDVEKRAVFDAIRNIGMRKVYLIEAQKAAALGAGLDINDSHGIFVVDIGGGTTDIAVISLGDIVTSRSIKIAGNMFDDEIVKYIKRKYNLIVGAKMAEEAKIAIGCIVPQKGLEPFTIKGRNAVTGIPQAVDITPDEMIEALYDPAMQIIRTMQTVLEQTSPELVSDIYSDGMTLTGGGSQLRGFSELIKNYLNLDVNPIENPADCVVNGCGKALKFTKLLKSTTMGSINPLSDK